MFILKELKVVCFDTLLQVLILKDLRCTKTVQIPRVLRGEGAPLHGRSSGRNKKRGKRREGRQMFYRTNAEAIRPLYEWASTFERLWQHQLQRVKERAEEKMKKA